MLSLLIVVVVAALLFDFINGFHDTANAIATSVSTGVLTVRTGVLMAGVLNFVGALLGTAVAGFIANKLVSDAHLVTQQVVLAALLGASAWNLITWWFGIPSSSSHALVGGLAGAVVAHAGMSAFQWSALGEKVLVPLVVSPVLGFLGAFAVMLGSLWSFRRCRPNNVNIASRYLQLASAGTLSFSHGMNDAQKAMGIITLALGAWMMGSHITPLIILPKAPLEPAQRSAVIATNHLVVGDAQHLSQEYLVTTIAQQHDQGIARAELPAWFKQNESWLLPTATWSNAKDAHGVATGKQDFAVPMWIKIACALAMALGTMAGGKKIIKTMGSKIIKISPLQGFAAQASGTLTILSASHFGIPVSTTHCITASVMGAGMTKGLAAVRWGTAWNIVIAWVLTLPASGAMAFVMLWILEGVFGAT